MKRLIDGIAAGTGFVMVVAVAFAIAWAGDVLTIDKDGTTKFAVSDAGKITVGATESYVNLVIQNDGTTPNNKVNITADVLTVEGVRLEGLNVSADVAAAVGAGGRDTNFADAANTWYYVWVITNNDGTQKNGILTLAPATPNPATPPVLPSGYTKKRRVGSVCNNGSSNFLQFVQEGNKANYLEGMGGAIRIVNVNAATSWTVASGAAFIPPTSRRGVFRLNPYLEGTVGVNYAASARRAGASTAGQLRTGLLVTVAGVSHTNSITGDIDTDATQQIEHMLDAAPTTGGLNVDVAGYYDRI